jgi:hypothetical protein
MTLMVVDDAARLMPRWFAVPVLHPPFLPHRREARKEWKVKDEVRQRNE